MAGPWSAVPGYGAPVSPPPGMARLQAARDGAARARRDTTRADGVLRQAEETLAQVQRELGTGGVRRGLRDDTARAIGDSLAVLQGPIVSLQHSPAHNSSTGVLDRSMDSSESYRSRRALQHVGLPRSGDGYLLHGSHSDAHSPGLTHRASVDSRVLPPPPEPSPPQHAAPVRGSQSPVAARARGQPNPSLALRSPAAPVSPPPDPSRNSAGYGAAPDGAGTERTERARLIQQRMADLERRISQHAQWSASDLTHPAAGPTAGLELSAPISPPPALSSVAHPRRSPRRSPRRDAGADDALAVEHMQIMEDYAVTTVGGGGGAGGGRKSPISINTDDLAALPAREREDARWALLREFVSPGGAPAGLPPTEIEACRRLLALREEYVAEERRVQGTELGLLLERKVFKEKLQRITSVVEKRSARFPRADGSGRDEMIFLNAMCLVLNQPLQ
eukprot:Hpha_TRINITY_DN15224_c0_g1::TRINITY_DN15224_c0_g1_i1::g.64414::m.64414